MFFRYKSIVIGAKSRSRRTLGLKKSSESKELSSEQKLVVFAGVVGESESYVTVISRLLSTGG